MIEWGFRWLFGVIHIGLIIINITVVVVNVVVILVFVECCIIATLPINFHYPFDDVRTIAQMVQWFITNTVIIIIMAITITIVTVVTVIAIISITMVFIITISIAIIITIYISIIVATFVVIHIGSIVGHSIHNIDRLQTNNIALVSHSDLSEYNLTHGQSMSINVYDLVIAHDHAVIILIDHSVAFIA